MSSTPSLGGALQTLDILCEFANAIKIKISSLIADGVMAASKFISSLFFPGDNLFRVKELTVGSSAHFVNNGGLQISENTPGDVLSAPVSLSKVLLALVIRKQPGPVAEICSGEWCSSPRTSSAVVNRDVLDVMH